MVPGTVWGYGYGDKMITHLGVIPDGNRRYAKKTGITFKEAYEQGFSKAEECLSWALDEGIKEITVYALSTENLKRNKAQLSVLITLFKKKLNELSEKEIIHENEIQVRVIGKPIVLGRFKKEIEDIHKSTEKYRKHRINICLGYGGRWELVDAVNHILTEGKKKINEKTLWKYMKIKSEPDLIIRTGGMRRLSNFLIFQSAYSELYFLDKLWPEITKKDFKKAIDWYKNIKRNFGT